MPSSIDSKQRAEELLKRLDQVFRLFGIREWTDTNWPTGYCTVASLLAAPFLRAYLERPDIKVILGKGHVWLEDDRGWIYDPTYQQFHRQWPTPWRVINPEFDQATFYEHLRMHTITREGEDYFRDTIKPEGTSELLISKAFREAALNEGNDADRLPTHR